SGPPTRERGGRCWSFDRAKAPSWRSDAARWRCSSFCRKNRRLSSRTSRSIRPRIVARQRGSSTTRSDPKTFSAKLQKKNSAENFFFQNRGIIIAPHRRRLYTRSGASRTKNFCRTLMTLIGLAYNQKPEPSELASPVGEGDRQEDGELARPDEEPPSKIFALSIEQLIARDEFAEWDTPATIAAVESALACL